VGFSTVQSKMNKFIAVGALAVVSSVARAEQPETPAITPAQIKQGSGMYAQHCAPCHGPRMQDPEGAFDLRKFPQDEYERFVRSVTNGKNSMPPWGGLFKRDEIDALWAYVSAGEKK
jgi:mono/diheme cytochrome c family protein